MSLPKFDLSTKPAKRPFGRRAEMSAPATKADIEELKRLILSMQPAAQNVKVTFSDRVDAISRSRYQVVGAHHVG